MCPTAHNCSILDLWGGVSWPVGEMGPFVNHLEERLLDQAGTDAVRPPFWGSFAQHTPRHDIGCPTHCKIIILPNKTIPPMDFLILRPLTNWVPFLGWGGGGAKFCG